MPTSTEPDSPQSGSTQTPPMSSSSSSEDELVAIIDRYDGAIAGDDPYTARVFEHATRLRIVSKWGVGVDNIDLEAAEARGIRVSNTPGAFGDEVADVIVGYLVLLARQLHRTDARAKAASGPRFADSRSPGRRSA